MFWENFLDQCYKARKTPTAVVQELGLSRGSVTNWKRGAKPNELTIKKIADYFNISITELNKNDGNVTISTGDINGYNNAIGNNPQVTVAPMLSSQEEELLTQFRKLSELEKAKALLYIAGLKKEEKE